MPSPQQSRPKAQRNLPDIGFDVPLWLQEFLAEAKTRIENLGQTPDLPAQPTGVTLTQQFPGILVSWNKALNAARYLIYRNSVGVFGTARLLGVQSHGDAISFLDITPTVSSATSYYWVVAENALGVQGPLSVMTTTTLPIFTTTIDVQQFLSSGTWTLPNSWTTGMANVTLVGGGGGGGNGATIVGGGGGGSGGGSGCTIIDTILLSSNQTITIGGGGAAVTAGTASTFGSLLTAAGGAAGGSASAINGGSAATFVRAITAGSAFITALNSMAGLRGGDGGSTTGGITPHDGMAGDPYPGKFTGGTGGATDAVSNGGGGGAAGYKGTGGAGGAAGGGAGTAGGANTGAGGGGGGGITVGSAGTGAAGGSGFCIVYAWRAS